MISATSLSIGYAAERLLLQDASFSIPSGSVVALLGRNGAGKSTLMRTIAGLQKPLSGSINIENHNIANLDETQRAMLVSLVTTERIRIPNLSCTTLVALGRSPHTNWLGTLTAEDAAIIDRAIERVGMSHLAHKSCDTLSDGELQRIMIARALAQQTPIILLDEPTAFLDMPSRYQLLALLAEIAHQENKTILLSTHELNLATDHCDAIALVDAPNIHILPAREPSTKQIIADTFSLSMI